MIIYHNMMADNAHRMMGINKSGMGKSVEKLSSGLRVNRAADDAAGLSISEKMRGQIRGLTQASRNAQDAVSVVQTAEGALDEVHSIIQRMRELAVQSANDSNVEIDRSAIQQEVSQLTDELDRISSTTQFNTMNLLDGTFNNKVFHIGANRDQNISVSINDLSAEGLSLRMQIDKASAFCGSEAAKAKKAASNVATYEVSVAGKRASIKSIQASMSRVVGSIKTLKASAASLRTKNLEGSAANQEMKVAPLEGSMAALQLKIDKLNSQIASLQNNSGSNSINFQNRMYDAHIAAAKAKGGILVNTQINSNAAIKTIDAALTKVSFQRSELGAIQNRMEHTIRNLDNAAENTQAAESRIRDVDMAKEMSKFTKDNILTQASQAMLAQANQLPQQVLQLLR